MYAAVTFLLAAPILQAGFRPVIVLEPKVPHAALLGGTAGSRWVKTDEAAKRVTGGERYRLFGESRAPAKATGGKAKVMDETGALFVALKPAPSFKGDAVGITGSWRPYPRRPMVVSPRLSSLGGHVKQYLRERNLPGAVVRIKQGFRVDLNGDRRAETIVVAERYGGQNVVPDQARPGDYSVVLLIAKSEGKTRVLRLASEVYPPVKPAAEPAPPNVRNIVDIIDLNADGKMEIVVKWNYYEGGGFDVYTFDGTRVRRVLEWAAGI